MTDLKQIAHPLGLQRLGYAKPLLDVAARHWEGGTVRERAEHVVEETPVAIVYNNIPHVVMMATPADLEDFVLGFSITEELIRTPADLQEVQVVRYGQGIEIQATIHTDCEVVVAGRTLACASLGHLVTWLACLSPGHVVIPTRGFQPGS